MIPNHFRKMLNELNEQIFARINSQLNQPTSISFFVYFSYAIEAWCNRLALSENLADYIIQNSRIHEVQELAFYLSQEAKHENKTWKIPTPLGEAPTIFSVENQFHKRVKNFLNWIGIREANMNEIILIIAFVVVAVIYLLYILKKQEQQNPRVREYGETDQILRLNPVPTKTKQILILVVNVLKSEIIETIKTKKQIEPDDCEKLYRTTEALWLGTETDLSPKLAECFSENNQFMVSPGAESEYDIYLMQIELKNPDNGFKPTADQLDRIDAFRNLSDLSVDIKVSPRLRVDAYENTGVYSR